MAKQSPLFSLDVQCRIWHFIADIPRVHEIVAALREDRCRPVWSHGDDDERRTFLGRSDLEAPDWRSNKPVIFDICRASREIALQRYQRLEFKSVDRSYYWRTRPNLDGCSEEDSAYMYQPARFDGSDINIWYNPDCDIVYFGPRSVVDPVSVNLQKELLYWNLVIKHDDLVRKKCLLFTQVKRFLDDVPRLRIAFSLEIWQSLMEIQKIVIVRSLRQAETFLLVVGDDWPKSLDMPLEFEDCTMTQTNQLEQSLGEWAINGRYVWSHQGNFELNSLHIRPCNAVGTVTPCFEFKAVTKHERRKENDCKRLQDSDGSTRDYKPLPYLPPEIRHLIWDFLAQIPRIHEFEMIKEDWIAGRYNFGHQLQYTPVVLYICRESRKLALEKYGYHFVDRLYNKAASCFNPYQDIIYCGRRGHFATLSNQGRIREFNHCKRYFDKICISIRKFAIDYMVWEKMRWQEKDHILRILGDIEEFILVIGDPQTEVQKLPGKDECQEKHADELEVYSPNTCLQERIQLRYSPNTITESNPSNRSTSATTTNEKIVIMVRNGEWDSSIPGLDENDKTILATMAHEQKARLRTRRQRKLTFTILKSYYDAQAETQLVVIDESYHMAAKAHVRNLQRAVEESHMEAPPHAWTTEEHDALIWMSSEALDSFYEDWLSGFRQPFNYTVKMREFQGASAEVPETLNSEQVGEEVSELSKGEVIEPKREKVADSMREDTKSTSEGVTALKGEEVSKPVKVMGKRRMEQMQQRMELKEKKGIGRIWKDLKRMLR